MSAAAFSTSRSILRWRASARSRNGASPRTRRDEPRRALALPTLAHLRLRRDNRLLERKRRARHGARIRDRAPPPAAAPAAPLGAQSLHRSLPRHALPRAALPSLFGRPFGRPQAERDGSRPPRPRPLFLGLFCRDFSRG